MRPLSFAVVVALASLATIAPVQASPPSYWMNCMGGPAVFVANYPDPSTAPLYGLLRMRVSVGIEAAPDMSTPLRPGQCRWLDRTLNNNEKGLAVVFWPRQTPPPPSPQPDFYLVDLSAKLAADLLAYAKEPKQYQMRVYRDGDLMHVVNVRR